MVAKKIIIYGINLQAAVLYKLITMEKQGEIECFVVDERYKNKDEYCGLRVVEFNRFISDFSPDRYAVCLSFGYKNMIRNREEKFYECQKHGYEIIRYISKNAVVYSDQLGEGCIIYPGAIIMPYVEIGVGTFIEAGVVIAHHSKIGEFNFIGPGAHFCGNVRTGSNCFIGGAAEIVNNCILGQYSFVAANAKVSHDVKQHEAILPTRSVKSSKSSDEMMEYMFRF